MKRARATSLLELLFAVSLVALLCVALAQSGSTAFRWRRTAQTIASEATRALDLRAGLKGFASEGELVERVALDAAGRPSSERVLAPSATWRSGPATLVVRTAEEFRILERCGSELHLRRIALDGRASKEVLARDVTAARFTATSRGLEWWVGFHSRDAGARPATSTGFVAFRIDRSGGTP